MILQISLYLEFLIEAQNDGSSLDNFWCIITALFFYYWVSAFHVISIIVLLTMKKAHSSKKNKGKLSSNKVSDGVTKTKDWPYLIIVAFLGKSIILLLVLIYIHVSSFETICWISVCPKVIIQDFECIAESSIVCIRWSTMVSR